MVWGLRLFLVLVGTGVVAIAVLVVAVVVRPTVTEARRSRAAGDWWLPFLPQAQGGWGPLVSTPRRSAMRAQEPGSTWALTVRWGFWTLMSVLVVLAAGVIVVDTVRLVALGWSSFD